MIASHASHNVDFAVQAYLAAGVPPDKIVVGMRFVATGWQGVPSANNGLCQDNGRPATGSWGEPGSIAFQDIEDNYLPTYTRGWQNEVSVPWLYNAGAGIMISYEDQDSVTAKANYVLANRLGGIMIRELAADDDQDTLVSTIAAMLAVTTLAQDIAAKAEFIVNTLTQTDYQHVEKIDPATGVYYCHCNGFVGYVLSNVAPQHYALIPKEANRPRPRAFKYFDFFASLTPESSGGCRRVDRLKHARRGDVMAWRFPTSSPTLTPAIS
jgi:hypothetical protein